VKFRTLIAVTGALALTAVSPAAAQARAVHPLTTCWYNVTINEVDSTQIQATAAPQCAGETPATIILWTYVPISRSYTGTVGDSANSGDPVVLTYSCDGQHAANSFQLQVSGGTPYNFAIYNLTDNCGAAQP
jgi:hypothetical protein